MQSESFDIGGPLMILPVKHTDARGSFVETYNEADFDKTIGRVRFVQDNHSISLASGTVRGLHFQAGGRAQAKLIRVLRGAIFDVVLDIRRQSPTFGQHITALLSSENCRQLWVPAGFAHGYCTLEPNTEVLYKVDQFWSPADERGILWNDPMLSIQWPGVAANAVVHPKDLTLPKLADCSELF